MASFQRIVQDFNSPCASQVSKHFPVDTSVKLQKQTPKMPIYHIVLFKLKEGTTSAQITKFADTAKAMVGKIPGLIQFQVGPPLATTKHRAQGYDMGLVAVLEREEDVAVYASHPAHLETQELREGLSDETLAYDLAF